MTDSNWPVSVNVSNTTAVAPPPPTSTTDTIKPVVTITSPSGGTSVTGKTSVTITANATDNKAVAKQTLYIDGKKKTSVTGASLSYTWSLSGVKAGSHTIKVIAYDAVSNSGYSTVQVER